jgi:HopA1 effector protein family
METAFYNGLTEIIKSIEILSSKEYTFNGHLSLSEVNPNYNLYDGQKPFNNDITRSIADLIYRTYHCRESSFNKNISLVSDYHDVIDFITLLSDANNSKKGWLPGWRIIKIEDSGKLAVYKDALTLWVNRQDFSSLNDSIQVGKVGYLKVEKGFRRLLPGFYMALSEIPMESFSENVVRLYWNIKESGAVTLVRLITTQLNLMSIPFKFKILNNPNKFYRTDSAVLYINKHHLFDISNEITTIYTKVKKFLNPETSLFTKRIAKGFALAEDLNGNESFGQSRSRIIAEAIYDAHTKGYVSNEDKFEKILNLLTVEGLNIDKPYLNKNSIDEYDILMKAVIDYEYK